MGKDLLTKKQKEELQSLIDEISDLASDVKKDYEKNPSELSGSVVEIHENCPALDEDKEGVPMYSGSRWTKVIKTNI